METPKLIAGLQTQTVKQQLRSAPVESHQDFWTVFDPNVTLEEMNRRYTLAAIAYHRGNKWKACLSLGITIKTLYNWLHVWGEFERLKTISKRKGKKDGNKENV